MVWGGPSLSGFRDRWRFVIVDGRSFSRAEVDARVEEYRRHFRGGWYSRVMGTVGVFSSIERARRGLPMILLALRTGGNGAGASVSTVVSIE